MKRSFIALIMTAFVLSSTAHAAITDAEDSAIHLFGKLESNLWESAAAVFFHIADLAREDAKIALNDYREDIDTIDRVLIKLQALQLTDTERQGLLVIADSFRNIQILGDELINADISAELSAPVNNSKMHNYWMAIESLDNLIDEEILLLAGDH
ncbi:MAG: hypothetical protein ABIG55_05040 [Candidatus Omnitrophota bacterium]